MYVLFVTKGVTAQTNLSADRLVGHIDLCAIEYSLGDALTA